MLSGQLTEYDILYGSMEAAYKRLHKFLNHFNKTLVEIYYFFARYLVAYIGIYKCSE